MKVKQGKLEVPFYPSIDDNRMLVVVNLFDGSVIATINQVFGGNRKLYKCRCLRFCIERLGSLNKEVFGMRGFIRVIHTNVVT
jgi:hypothetical protein